MGRTIRLAPGLDLAYFEPSTDRLRFGLQPSRESTGAAAHFRQGDLDGACGLYSVTIALAIHGSLDQDAVDLDKSRKASTRFGRALRGLSEQVGGNLLLSGGLSTEHLRGFVRDFWRLDIEELEGEGAKLVKQIRSRLDEHGPVVISVPNHWTVAIGYEVDEGDELTRFFLLDPGFPTPTMGYWNGVLTRRGRRYVFDWHGGDHHLGEVPIEQAFTVVRP